MRQSPEEIGELEITHLIYLPTKGTQGKPKMPTLQNHVDIFFCQLYVCHDAPDLARRQKMDIHSPIQRLGMQSQKKKNRLRTQVNTIQVWELTKRKASQTMQGFFFVYKNYTQIRVLQREKTREVSTLLLDFNVALDDL